MFNQTGEPVGY